MTYTNITKAMANVKKHGDKASPEEIESLKKFAEKASSNCNTRIYKKIRELLKTKNLY